ncbi:MULTISPECIES: S9 family peptidase [Microbacterium]|uniref:S9 family peptidase n=1 Tax=Microbacterium wangchenii TaxID=2541726 RepID=A0ABX5STT8_9MICO|nr:MULTISPECIES: S9 family peptidase [Microbacterium]MCK6065211.1 S9 family peptidase [Microbacterium sp. EYE_512]QBR88662.1 S9 family peptidase [Microbacterium wangchenii]TXK20386.1 S9 family peptidase [Microbacterium wangchenii]
MRADDIEALVSLGRPAIARDASFAIVASSRPDIAANRNVGQLWRIALPDGKPRRLTRGTADAAPEITRDGGRVGFLRADAKGRPQVFVVASGGGEPVQATDAPSGVEAFAWSPDGTRLAYTARVAENGRYGTVEGLDATAEAPRRITAIRWNANGLGYLADRPAQLFVVDAPDLEAEPFYEPAPRVLAEGEEAPAKPVVTSEAVALTEGPVSWGAPAWTADGREILVVPDVLEHDAPDLRRPVVAVAVEGSATREVVPTAANLDVNDVAVADDGTVFLLANDVGPRGLDFVAPGVALWIVADNGRRILTDPETIDLGEVGSRATPIGSDVLVQDRTRGRVRLLRITRDGDVTEVLGGDVEVAGVAAAGERIIASVSTPESLGELVLIDGAGSPRVITDFGAALTRAGLVAPRELEVPARDGYPVHGWIATPEGEGPFPVLLQIHGGPYATYGVHAFDETQVLVDAGYAVVYCNPRGSAGYGRSHGRAIRGAMGTVDYTDIMDFLDGALAADERLDADRVGVMGGSYGGYMTAWIIAHESRFAGAIVERGFLDPVSFQGTSDIGTFFGDEYVGTDPDAMRAQSPMAVVDRVTTPTLVIHSELDFRCPLEQATRYYSALKRQGTEVEMLIFPGENHELTRGGQPRHRVERFAAILDWWARHLPTGT